ncbi:uncharacterized protein LOC105444605 [Strongylocentrotus purpuratus]|uniref:Uncharacterized protein n=1 Tax=Strongylocentrotus purpuratus TaxID=7668 RepID=A0A7M7PGI6_STRPU|nr:uncharacterized protein LOC105444605 [Strongylocentrotus purpuratus]
MGRQPEPDTTHDDESGYESVGKREMLWAVESIYSAVKDGSVTTSDYQFKFTTAKYNKQAGSCNRRARRSSSYEPEFSVEMLVAVKKAFEDIENGSLKEGGYYFELSTPHFQFTSGCYPRQEKEGGTYVDDKQEPILLCSPDDKSFVAGLLYMIHVIVVLETVRTLLLASPVGANHITGGGQHLTLTAGENGIIPFACRNEQQFATKYYTVKFEEKDRPFYINGIFDPEGLTSPDQAERFSVQYFEQGSAMSVEINIASVSVEDQGTYIVVLIIQGETNENHSMKKHVLIFIPPSPAVCFLTPSESMENFYEVHCHSKPGSGDSTLTCFQNDDKIPYQKDGGDTQIVYRRIFWLMDIDIPVFCCSHDITEMGTITQTSCDQYRHPRIEPTNSPISPGDKIPTKIVQTTKPLSVEEEKKQPSLEITPYSGCIRNADWHAVILPLMALFTYMCISNP